MSDQISLAKYWDSLTHEEKVTIYMLLNRRDKQHVDYAELAFVPLGDVFEAIGEGFALDFLTLQEREAFSASINTRGPAARQVEQAYIDRGKKRQQELIIKLGWNDHSLLTNQIFGG